MTRTQVRAVATPATVDDVRAVIRAARNAGHAVSIAGGRHSMGGQPFGEQTVLVDTRGLDRVLAFDRAGGTVTVEGGIQWPALLAYLDAAQRKDAHPWGICQKQTGADRLTLAGALSCNAHGRGLSLRPIVDQVEQFELINADAELVRCTRTENPELFSLAVGGYGLFGVITSVVLRLRRRCNVRRVVQITDTRGLMEQFAERVRDGFEYGDFQFAIDSTDASFLDAGVFSCYAPVAFGIEPTERPVHFSRADWLSLAVEAHRNKERAFRKYADGYLRTNGQVYTSDAQLSGPYFDDYHDHVTRTLGHAVPGTEMITELYVPRPAFEPFMACARDVLRSRHADVVYGTVRVIEPDRETVLAWAREPWACVVLNLHVDHEGAAVAAAADTFRALIDAAMLHGGSYYLAYHRWARREQVERCHPRMRAFLEAKRRYDPREVFQSEWYRWYTRMFATHQAGEHTG
jgi:FAD/FMN-containing dehydrogenase